MGVSLRLALVAFVALVVACFALASCAAVMGLGDLQRVDCVGACDGGGADGTASDVDSSDGQVLPDTGPLELGRIGGTVSGLRGTGLVLKDNGGDDLQIAADGPFVFPTRIRTGDTYAVTVGSQPSSPAQTCTVASGSGTVRGADVTDVRVTCATSAYSVGGIVVGLSGTGLVLTNNGGDDLSVAASGAFAFATKIASGAAYSVAVKTQPATGGPCAVSGGAGTMGGADVTGVVVNCAPGTYTVGGTVSGLTGAVVLQNNGGNDLTLTSNGTFAFSQTLTPGAAYAVTIRTQPGYPPRSQTCTVTGGTGTVANANVTSVTVTCATNTFTVGGNVTGLSGTLVLRNNGADPLTLTASGAFTFATPVPSGNAYSVTVGAQPSGQSCTVTSGSGTVANGAVTNVAVACGSAVDPGIVCGASTCNPVTQRCCWESSNKRCLALADPCADTPMDCDTAQDCVTKGLNGYVCCAKLNMSRSNTNFVTCELPASCVGTDHLVMCDPSVSGACTTGTCQASVIPPTGYNVCR